MAESDISDTSPVDDQAGFEKCQRSQQRRNTDFSQADNDLKRFLSEREHNKRRESDGDILPPEPSFNR